MAADEEKAAKYFAWAAELWKAAAEADRLVDRDAFIKAAKAFERMAQRVLRHGAIPYDWWLDP